MTFKPRSCLVLAFTTLSTLMFGQPGGIPKANTEGIKNKILDLAYASKSGAQKLDIYLPELGDGPFPVIVQIHGGAFRMGDKGDSQVNASLEGLTHGYAVVSINYRLSGEAIFPAQIQDVKAAIRFLRANAKKYKLNPDKIATWGGSAGGHLAAMAGTTGDVKEFDDVSLGNDNESSKVQAVVDWFGPIEFNQMDPQFRASGKGKTDHDEANSPESELVGKQITSAPELVKRASPATYISKNDPPFFIQHGTEDPLVPVEQSKNFYSELIKVLDKDKVSMILLEGAGHGGPQFGAAENLDKVFAFLDRYLK
ncbi:MAG TPA: alpha/beta hydrolase [Chryseolinea sp.]|nr:alpha/beta hydrolase [Chryseolinea sp.]